MTKQTQGKRGKAGKKLGSVDDARAILWAAISRAGEQLEQEQPDPAMTLKFLHGISQAARSYAHIVETSDLAARLKALEAAQSEQEAAK